MYKLSKTEPLLKLKVEERLVNSILNDMDGEIGWFNSVTSSPASKAINPSDTQRLPSLQSLPHQHMSMEIIKEENMPRDSSTSLLRQALISKRSSSCQTRMSTSPPPLSNESCNLLSPPSASHHFMSPNPHQGLLPPKISPSSLSGIEKKLNKISQINLFNNTYSK